MALRAVIFDYGMVLTGAPDTDAHDAMIRITGLSPEHFEALYWADRHAYDEGKLLRRSLLAEIPARRKPGSWSQSL